MNIFIRTIKILSGTIFLSSIFINRVLLNENYNGLINNGYFYLFFCKKLEQQLFVKNMKPILSKIDFNASVLDFGSGPGIMSDFFENYIGIDTDESRIKTALKYFPKKSFQKIDLITKSNPYLPFQNNTFDIVLFNDCVHHISNYNMNFILLEINRILKKNGIIIIREPKKDTTLFTYLITEIFENGNYVRNKNEYKEIFNSFTPIYEVSNYEYIRDYYVLIVKKTKNICLNNINIVDTPNYKRFIISYFIFLIYLYNIYYLFNNIL